MTMFGSLDAEMLAEFDRQSEIADHFLRQQRARADQHDEGDAMVHRDAGGGLHRTDLDPASLHQAAPRDPQAEFVTQRQFNEALGNIAADTGDLVGEWLKKLQDQINELRGEIAALKSGNVTPITKGRQNAA